MAETGGTGTPHSQLNPHEILLQLRSHHARQAVLLRAVRVFNDVKLCSRRHANPRTAEVCSLCGSRDLSVPQPRRPAWVMPLGLILTVLPGAFLSFASIVVVLAVIIAAIQRPDTIVVLILLAIPFGILWGMWSETPSWFRSWVYRLLKRKRERREGGGE